MSHRATDKEARFIAYGDMGDEPAPSAVTTTERAIVEATVRGYDSFLLHFGDVSYAMGEAYSWDRYGALLEPLATRVPYHVTGGRLFIIDMIFLLL